MWALGSYDGNLQMFVERPRDPGLARLKFLRWLAERAKLEHPVAGPPGGQYARAARFHPDEARLLAGARSRWESPVQES